MFRRWRRPEAWGSRRDSQSTGAGKVSLTFPGSIPVRLPARIGNRLPMDFPHLPIRCGGQSGFIGTGAGFVARTATSGDMLHPHRRFVRRLWRSGRFGSNRGWSLFVTGLHVLTSCNSSGVSRNSKLRFVYLRTGTDELDRQARCAREEKPPKLGDYREDAEDDLCHQPRLGRDDPKVKSEAISAKTMNATLNPRAIRNCAVL